MAFNENYLYSNNGKFLSGNTISSSATGLTTSLTDETPSLIKTYTNLPVGVYLYTQSVTITCATDATFDTIYDSFGGTNSASYITGAFGIPYDLAANDTVTVQFVEILTISAATNSSNFYINAKFSGGTFNLTSWVANLTKL